MGSLFITNRNPYQNGVKGTFGTTVGSFDVVPASTLTLSIDGILFCQGGDADITVVLLYEPSAGDEIIIGSVTVPMATNGQSGPTVDLLSLLPAEARPLVLVPGDSIQLLQTDDASAGAFFYVQVLGSSA